MGDSRLRRIPSVDQTLAEEEVSRLLSKYTRQRLVKAIRAVLADLRQQIRSGDLDESKVEALLSPRRIAEQIESRLAEENRLETCRVLNGTGIVLHTGLGRAPLSPAILAAIAEEVRGYTLLEVDRETGERGERESVVSDLISRISGAEAATVVNNNAGATLLALTALARGKEVIVSRGELIEIGGSYRLPDVFEQSGAILREVGTTNRTRISDYAGAITDETGLLLRVHTSNYRIVGFVEQTPLKALVALGKEHGVPVMDDLGSGSFVDLDPFGLRGEPTVQGSLETGADLATFSGDKLLGGPQAGIIVGRKDLVHAARSHPLYRALRVDKITLVALEATLRLYLDGDRIFQQNLALRLITMEPEEIRKRADRVAQEIRRDIPDLTVSLVEERSQVGSGSLPTEKMSTYAVALRPKAGAAHRLARDLRLQTPPVFTRLKENRVIIDFRTILEGEEVELVRAIRQAMSPSPKKGRRKRSKG